METLCAESSHWNQKLNTPRLLETLFWVRQSSRHPVQRFCTTWAVSERTLAWWARMPSRETILWQQIKATHARKLFGGDENLLTANYPGGIWIEANNELWGFQHTWSIVASDCTSAQVLSHSSMQTSETTNISEADERARAELLWIIKSQTLLLRDKNFDNWKKQWNLEVSRKDCKCWRPLFNQVPHISSQGPLCDEVVCA